MSIILPYYIDEKQKLVEVQGPAKVTQSVNGRVHTLTQKGTIHFCFFEKKKIERREENAVNRTQIN